MQTRRNLTMRVMAVGVLLALGGCQSAPATDPGESGEPGASVESGGDTARGQALYYAHACYSCHGYNGQTGAHDLVGTGSPILADADAFTAFLRLRADVMPLYPSTAMPNYPETSLDDDAARDLFAYIQTFTLDAPAVADVPALEAVLESASRP